MAALHERRGQALCAALGFALVGLTVVTAAFLFAMHGRANAISADPLDEVDAREADCPVDWDYWRDVNPDIRAWIRVPGTSIDYPVLQAPADDPLFYLTHDVYRNWNLWGCPYVDPDCKGGMESPNVIVYGHNMTTDGTMFHDFENYRDEGFASEHGTIRVYTPGRTRTLQVVGAKTIDGTEPAKRTSFDSAADFFAYRHAELASCDMRIEPDHAKSQLFTFCTCSYYFNPENERTLVFAQE